MTLYYLAKELPLSKPTPVVEVTKEAITSDEFQNFYVWEVDAVQFPVKDKLEAIDYFDTLICMPDNTFELSGFKTVRFPKKELPIKQV